jgi:drug/metabolite transporter (DMT)-like permease
MRFRPDHPYLLLALAALLWSGNWIVGRGFRHDVPPIALGFWRWVIAVACVLPFAWPHLRRQWRLALAGWKNLVLLGVIGTALYNTLCYVGLQYTTATNGMLLNSFIPIVIICISWLFLGKQLHALEWTGVFASLLGVLTIVARGDPATLLGLSLNVGDLWILISVFGWAIYTVCLQWRPGGLHPLAFLACISVIGVISMLPAYAWEIDSGRSINHSVAAWAGIAYTGVFAAFLGFIFWNRGVAEVGGNRAGLFIHLMPVFGTLLSLFLGEHPVAYHFAGIGLILGGIWLTTLHTPKLSQ